MFVGLINAPLVLINSSIPTRKTANRKLEVVEWHGQNYEFAGVFSFRDYSKLTIFKWLSENLNAFKRFSIADMFHTMRESLIKEIEFEIVEGGRNWAHMEHIDQ